MKAKTLAKAILQAIKSGELNADADVAMAEELQPGIFRFLDATKVMTPPGDKSCFYLVQGTEDTITT